MLKRFAIGMFVLSTAFLGFGPASTIVAADAPAGSIKGEITANGVRSPEDVVVYIETMPGEQKPPDKPVTMNQKKLVFLPHVLPIVKGTTVKFQNGDPLLHNVFWTASDDGSYPAKNLGSWGQGDTRTFTFDNLGHVVLLCNIHAEMEGHIVVLQNPYFAVVGKDGDYEIKNVPPGDYEVKTWYPKPKKLKSKSAKVTVQSGAAASLDFTLGK